MRSWHTRPGKHLHFAAQPRPLPVATQVVASPQPRNFACLWPGPQLWLSALGANGAPSGLPSFSGCAPPGTPRLTLSDGSEGDGLLAAVDDSQHVIAGQAGHPDPLHLQQQLTFG